MCYHHLWSISCEGYWQGQAQLALKAFAEEVYYKSREYGIYTVQTSFAFYNLYRVFASLVLFSTPLKFPHFEKNIGIKSNSRSSQNINHNPNSYLRRWISEKRSFLSHHIGICKVVPIIQFNPHELQYMTQHPPMHHPWKPIVTMMWMNDNQVTKVPPLSSIL